MTEAFEAKGELTPSLFIKWRKYVKEKENITDKAFKIRFLMALSEALQDQYSESEILKLEVTDLINRKTLLLLYNYSSNLKHVLPKEFKIVYLLQQMNMSLGEFWRCYGSRLPINMAKEQISDANYVDRIDDLVRIKSVLNCLKQEKSEAANYCALVGVGGIGKSYLAAGLGNEVEVKNMFPDGILWLQLSRDASQGDLYDPSLEEGRQSHFVNLQNVIAHLESAFGVSSEDELDSKHSLEYFVSLCEGRSLLLIVDDVWEGEPLKELCKLLKKHECNSVCVLMTTRLLPVVNNLEVASKYCVEIDSVTDEEAYRMLQANIDDHIPEKYAKALLECSENWPLLISLINKRLKINLSQNNESDKENIYQSIVTQLTQGGRIVLHDRSQPNKNHYSISKCLLNTFQYLEKIDQEAPVGRHSRMDRYLSMCVFPSSVSIPLGVLSLYWNEPLPVVVTICEDLLRLRLIKDVKCRFQEDDAVRLSSPLMKYLRDKSKHESNYVLMQRKLVERFHRSINKKEHCHFSGGFVDEVNRYFWSNYSYHSKEGQ